MSYRYEHTDLLQRPNNEHRPYWESTLETGQKHRVRHHLCVTPSSQEQFTDALMLKPTGRHWTVTPPILGESWIGLQLVEVMWALASWGGQATPNKVRFLRQTSPLAGPT